MDDLAKLVLFYNGQELSALVKEHFMKIYGDFINISKISFNSDLELSHPFTPTEKADKDLIKCTYCDLVVRYCDTALYSSSNGTPNGCDLGRGVVSFHIREHMNENCKYHRVQIIKVDKTNYVTPSALKGLYTDATAIRKAEKEGCQAIAQLHSTSIEKSREEIVTALTRATLKAEQAGFAYLKELPDADIVKAVKEFAEKKDLASDNLAALMVPNIQPQVGPTASQVRTIRGGSRYHIRGGSGPNTLTSAVPYNRASLLLDANVLILPAHLVGGAFEIPESIEKAGQDVASWVKETSRKTGESAAKIWKDLANYINGDKKIDRAVESLNEVAKKTTDNVKESAKSAVDAINDATKKTIDNIKDLGDKTGVNESVRDFANKASEEINKATVNLGESVKELIIPVSGNTAVLKGEMQKDEKEIPVTSASASSAQSQKGSTQSIRGGSRSSPRRSHDETKSHSDRHTKSVQRSRYDNSDTITSSSARSVSDISLTTEK
jgi:hypothetical protein